MCHRGYIFWSILIVVTLFLLWQLLLIAMTLTDVLIGFPSSVEFERKNRSGHRIAPIIHQMWKTSNLSSYPINTSYAEWQKIYPNYTVRLWTDVDLDRLISSKEYSYLADTYRSYPFNIQRADLARLIVLHSEGGIYADLDVFPVNRSIEDLRSSGASFIIPRSSSDSCLINHFLVSERHSIILDYILRHVPSASLYRRILLVPYLQVFSTGSTFLTRILRQWLKTCSHSEDKLWILSGDDVAFYVTHYPGRSWHMLDGYLLNQIDAKRKFLSQILICSLVLLFFVLQYRKKICSAIRSKRTN